jgi:hypothetical protein
MSAPNRRGDRILHQVTVRATTHLEFRHRLLEDPAKAIHDEFGVTIPSGHVLRFLEKPVGVDTLIVLPDFRHPSGELCDDDLDEVAGGTGGCYEETTVW